MPRPRGRQLKEKVEKEVKPRGAPRKIISSVESAVEPKGGKMAGSSFCGESPCRVVIHWVTGEVRTDEVMCKSYSFNGSVLYLATAAGEQIIPGANIKRIEVIRA